MPWPQPQKPRKCISLYYIDFLNFVFYNMPTPFPYFSSKRQVVSILRQSGSHLPHAGHHGGRPQGHCAYAWIYFISMTYVDAKVIIYLAFFTNCYPLAWKILTSSYPVFEGFSRGSDVCKILWAAPPVYSSHYRTNTGCSYCRKLYPVNCGKPTALSPSLTFMVKRGFIRRLFLKLEEGAFFWATNCHVLHDTLLLLGIRSFQSTSLSLRCSDEDPQYYQWLCPPMPGI